MNKLEKAAKVAEAYRASEHDTQLRIKTKDDELIHVWIDADELIADPTGTLEVGITVNSKTVYLTLSNLISIGDWARDLLKPITEVGGDF